MNREEVLPSFEFVKGGSYSLLNVARGEWGVEGPAVRTWWCEGNLEELTVKYVFHQFYKSFFYGEIYKIFRPCGAVDGAKTQAKCIFTSGPPSGDCKLHVCPNREAGRGDHSNEPKGVGKHFQGSKT
jgi:hypothetical protein